MDERCGPGGKSRWRTSTTETSLRLLYTWLCIGMLIITGMFALSAVLGAYYSVTNGGPGLRPWPAALQVLALACYGGSAVYAVRALRLRSASNGFGRHTAIGGIYFGLAVMAMLLYGAVTQ